MKCSLCPRYTGDDIVENEAVVIQLGEALDDEGNLIDELYYPVCKEHKVETGIYPDERVIPIPSPGLPGSPTVDLHMVLEFIRHHFDKKPLPGLEHDSRALDLQKLEDERLSKLIQLSLAITKAEAEMDSFIEKVISE